MKHGKIQDHVYGRMARGTYLRIKTNLIVDWFGFMVFNATFNKIFHDYIKAYV